MKLYFTRDVPNVPIFTLKLCPETFLGGILCTIQKNCPFTFIMMLIFSHCTVSSYNGNRGGFYRKCFTFALIVEYLQPIWYLTLEPKSH